MPRASSSRKSEQATNTIAQPASTETKSNTLAESVDAEQSQTFKIYLVEQDVSSGRPDLILEPKRAERERSGVKLQKIKDELKPVLLACCANRASTVFSLKNVIVVADCPREDEETGEIYWVYKEKEIRQSTHNVVPVSEDVNRVLYYILRDLVAEKAGRDTITMEEVNSKADWLWSRPRRAQN